MKTLAKPQMHSGIIKPEKEEGIPVCSDMYDGAPHLLGPEIIAEG